MKRANPALCRALGLSAEVLVGARVLAIVQPGDRPRVLEAAARLARGEPVDGLEVEARTRVGSGRRYAWECTALPEEGLVHCAGRDVSERRAREDRYRAIFEHNLDAVFISAPDGTITRANPAACRLFGMPEEELRRRGRAGLVESGPELDTLLQARTLSRSASGLLTCRRADGTLFRAEVSSALIGGGPSEATFVILRDVTEREEMNAALREAEERWRLLVEYAPARLAMFDREMRYLSASRRWLQDFGLEGQNLRGRSHYEVFPDLPERWKEVHRRALAGEVVRAELDRFERADGSVQWVRFEARPWRDATGAIAGIVLFSEDLTSIMKARDALRESAERFRTLADNIAQLAWMADARGSVFWFNERWFDYTGTSLDEVKGWGWTKVAHADHVERVVAKISRCFETGEQWEDTFPLRGRDGGYRWFLSRALPIRAPDGTVQRWFGTNTDVTEQLKAEEALREADRRKDQFLAILSHELRNPLAPIRNSVYVLERAPPGSAQAARAREVIARQSRHIARLVDDLLDLTRISRGRISLRREKLDLRGLASSTLEDHRELFARGGIELQLRLPEQPILVEADPTRLAQVVGNLLGNAAKFTPRGGHTVLSVEAGAPGRAVLCVQDDGAGMTPETLGRLFVPFAQADTTLDRSRGGLGLGLALVKGLVEMHGGTVRGDSPGLGEGSRFTVELPRLAAARVGPAERDHRLDLSEA